MIRIKYLVAAATLSLVLTGCSSNNEVSPDSTPAEMYSIGQQKLQDGNYKAAIKQLEALDNRYPFGPYAQQVQLDLIYAYYKSAELPMAIAAIDRFMRLNPTHPNIDYVLYMRGLTAMALMTVHCKVSLVSTVQTEILNMHVLPSKILVS